MKRHLQIPKDVNVILTHFPPWGIGDYNTQITRDTTGNSGDIYLRCVSEITCHICHVFGHARDGAGVYRLGGVMTDISGFFINVAGEVMSL